MDFVSSLKVAEGPEKMSLEVGFNARVHWRVDVGVNMMLLRKN